MQLEYFSILIFIIFSIVLSFILFLLSYSLIPKDYNSEKISAYECGFDPFEDTRSKFDVRFYLVAILFIIFDLEVVFLFPWSIVLSDIGFEGHLSVFVFLILLIVGFIYEWIKGALSWE